MDIMIAEAIQKTDKTLEERGLPEDSFFEVVFADGSWTSERYVNWSSISEEIRVEYFGGTKTVFVCKLPVKRIEVHHEGLVASLDVSEGCQVFQAVRSESIITDGKKENRILGRVIGLVKDGEVIEEQFINEIMNEVLGTRK